MKKLLFPAILVLGFLFQHTVTSAQSLTPRIDTSFNHVGHTALDWFLFFEPLEMLVQPDGKILVGGYGRSTQGVPLDGYLFRLNSDGSLDNSFGDNGFYLADVDGGVDAIQDLLMLPDGKILVLLESAYRTILIKLLPNGSNDVSFGNDGYQYVPTDQQEFANEMLMQADGKIIILSDQIVDGAYQIGTVRRCNADGSLDTSYGNEGSVKVIIDLSKQLRLTAGVLQADGKLLATGSFGAGPESGFPVIRLNTNGSFDNSFSGDGIYVKTLGNSINSAVAECIAVHTDGKIFVGGSSPTLTDVPMTVVSLTSTGGTNSSFGTFGVARIPFNLFASARKIIIQSDGKILAGGYKFQTLTTTRLALARFNTNGTPDLTFGDQLGRFVDSINVPYDVQIIQDMALQPDGKLVGMVWMSETANLGSPDNTAACYVVRYLTDIAVKAEEPSLVFQQVSVSPNPVVEETFSLSYTLEKPCQVSVSLYNAAGMQMNTLLNSAAGLAGQNNLQLHLPQELQSGVYFVVLTTGNSTKVVKLIKQ